MATWTTSSGISDLVPYMNAEGPSAFPTYLNAATRPTFAIGTAVRFQWIVPTGTTPFNFNLFIHGKRAKVNTDHALIENVIAGNWVANGTVVLHGVTWDIYYRDIVLSDTVPGLYSICLAQNGLHYMESNGNRNFISNGSQANSFHHDGGFILNPTGRPHYDDLPDRTELHSRVAGEKAWYADEFITGSQLEAGDGIVIKYRTSAGVATGYGTDATRAWNIIIEATGIVGVRENVVAGFNLTTGVATSWSTGTAYTPINELSFASEPEWTLDNTLARTGGSPGTVWDSTESIPVTFDVVESPSGKARVMARTLHSGLFASHDDGVTVTQFNATANNSISHIRFKDTASVAWTVAQSNLDAGGATGYRSGITIEATVAVYAGWRISDDALDFDLITTNEEVQFVGLKGVTTNLVLGTPNQLEISRPFQIQDQDVNVGNDATTTLNFEDGTNTTVTVTDDGSGKRTVKIDASLTAGSEDSFRSHWWNGIDANYMPNDADRITWGYLGQNGYWHYMNFGPCGMYQDGTWGILVGDGYEQTIIDGTNFTEAAIPPPVFQAWRDHATPRSLVVGADGIYNINVTASGHHSRHPDCSAGGIGPHRLDMPLFLLVVRGGIYYMHQFNDRYQWVQYVPNGFNTPGYGNIQRSNGHGDSIPWTVQGSCLVYLEDGDEILGLIGANIQFYNGVNNPYGDYRRVVNLRYYTFDVAFVKQGTSAGSITLHTLNNFMNNGQPINFEYFGW